MKADRPEPRWITQTMIMTIHADQIRQHGGDQGLRDQGLLESALAKAPQRHYYDPNADIENLAAAYGFDLARNHPFIDGNKRVAFMAMYVFLGLNGYHIVTDEPEAVTLMCTLAAGELDEDALTTWLQSHTQPR